jgi:2-polyprenyl-3-methyl-5-hydroxy-6-metoxy-1,4-benzoquinol methylase
MLDVPCRICGTDALTEVSEFGRLPRVTSDCKPFPSGGRIAVCGACGGVQKPEDPRWLAEIDLIYREYEIYFQSGGVEQAVFEPLQGVPKRRSAALLERVAHLRKLRSQGTMLDVGCGRGAMLAAFGAIRPQWRLYGHELSPRDTELLDGIPGFEKLYSGPLNQLQSEFDLITLMHSLEHFTNPLEGLEDIRNKLNPAGTLLIEVPNAAVSPFDLIIADHATHFSRLHLEAILKRAAFSLTAVADDWIVKELSAVASPNNQAEPVAVAAAVARESMDRTRSHLNWLHEVLHVARQAARQSRGRFGIFGTSIASNWLFGELGEEVSFFVDEDPSRQQHGMYGRPVFAPAEVPAGYVVFLALIPVVARALLLRFDPSGVEYICPPGL